MIVEWHCRPVDTSELDAWQGRDGGSAGIVSTVRGADSLLRSFIAWHVCIGFDQVILYLDDPSELVEVQNMVDGIPNAASYVKLVPCNEAHWAELRSCSLWPAWGAWARDEVQSRQILNAEHALRHAMSMGLSWLLHIDKDEAFYCGCEQVGDHFLALKSQGVSVMRYVNFEAVIEQLEVGDPMVECTLFRRHMAAIKPTTREAIDRFVGALEFWGQRNPAYFEAYVNGKGVVAVMQGALPHGVHSWLPAMPALAHGASHNFLYDDSCIAQYGAAGRLVQGQLALDACIMHYNNAVGYAAWERRFTHHARTRYTVMGVYKPLAFTQKCIEACSSDDATSMAFYKEHVVLDDHEEVERQVSAGVCVRVHRMAHVLQAAPQERAEVLAKGAPSVHLETA